MSALRNVLVCNEKLLLLLTRGAATSLATPNALQPALQLASFYAIKLLKVSGEIKSKSNQITFIVISPKHKCLGE